MKKITSVIIALTILLSCTCVFAEKSSFLNQTQKSEVYLNGTYIGVLKDVQWNHMIPLAKAMTTLGYSVSYDAQSSTVSASNAEIAYYFDIPKALVWSIKNGERVDLCLHTNPVILDGTTFVSLDFFSNILNLYVDRDYSEEAVTVYMFDLTSPAERLRDTYKKFLDKYKENGYDINAPQEYRMSMDFTTNVKCDMLGISITGGGKFDMSAYCDLANKKVSCSYDGDLTGIFNIYKLMNREPLDEAKPVSMDVYMDEGALYQRSNLSDFVYDGMAKDKWIKTELGSDDSLSLDLENTAIYKEMLTSLLTMGDIGAKDVITFCNSVNAGFDKLFSCAQFTKEDGKNVVTTKLTTADVKDIVLDIVSNSAVGFYYCDRDYRIENQIVFFNKFFETANISTDEKTVIADNKIESQTSVFDISFVYTVPDVNLPIAIKITGSAEASATTDSGVLKQPPAFEDIFDADAYWSNTHNPY